MTTPRAGALMVGQARTALLGNVEIVLEEIVKVDSVNVK